MDLAAILEDLPVAVWVGKVPDGATAYANRACEQIARAVDRRSPSRSTTCRAYGLVTRDGNPYPVESLPFSRVLSRRAARSMVDDIVVRRDGGDVYLRCVRFPVADASGKLTHVIVAFFDISRRSPPRSNASASRRTCASRAITRPIADLDDRRGGRDHDVGGRGAAVPRREIGPARRQEAAGRLRRAPHHPGYIRRGFAGESFWYTVEVGEAVYHSLAGAAARSLGRGGRPGRPVARHQRASPPAADDDAERSGDGARDAGGERGARDQQPAHLRPRARRGRGAGAGRAREAGRPAEGPAPA